MPTNPNEVAAAKERLNIDRTSTIVPSSVGADITTLLASHEELTAKLAEADSTFSDLEKVNDELLALTGKITDERDELARQLAICRQIQESEAR